MSAPGVIDVVTFADLDIGPYPSANPIFDDAMVRPLLASDRVRFVGEPVVAIVAESLAQAQDAAELVDITYQPRVAIVEEAAATEWLRRFDPSLARNSRLGGLY